MGWSSMKRKRARKIANRIRTLATNHKTSMVEECDSSSGFCSREALIQNSSNFRRSSTPSRFMFFCNDMWNDFDQEVFKFLKAGFGAGLLAVEGSVEGSDYLFDFLRMLQVDLVSGCERSIAWIDVTGQCFFPKEVVGKGKRTIHEVPHIPKLEIEIRIENGFPKESNKSSDSSIEQTDETPVNGLDMPKEPCLDKPCIESESPTIRLNRPKWPNVEILKEDDSSYTAIKNTFLSGIRRFNPDVNITSICRCLYSGPFGNARAKTFQNQIKMTKAIRGSANLKLAWYGTSAEGVNSIVSYGFGQPSRCSCTSDVYGVGVYLSPLHMTHTSAALSVADHNGEKHVILCRVIMGNIEKIDAGSLQFHPSSEKYDCGVDDLSNPRRHIVWSTHMNLNILPEYVVSFTSPDCAQGPARASLSRTWAASSMSFAKLLTEMGKFLPSPRLQALWHFYDQYKAGKVAKDLLVRQLRSIAGDRLLTATIQKIRGH